MRKWWGREGNGILCRYSCSLYRHVRRTIQDMPQSSWVGMVRFYDYLFSFSFLCKFSVIFLNSFYYVKNDFVFFSHTLFAKK